MCSEENSFELKRVNASMATHDLQQMITIHTENYCFFVCVQCRLTKFVPSTELDYTIKVNMQISKLANFDLHEYSLFSCS